MTLTRKGLILGAFQCLLALSVSDPVPDLVKETLPLPLLPILIK